MILEQNWKKRRPTRCWRFRLAVLAVPPGGAGGHGEAVHRSPQRTRTTKKGPPQPNAPPSTDPPQTKNRPKLALHNQTHPLHSPFKYPFPKFSFLVTKVRKQVTKPPVSGDKGLVFGDKKSGNG